MFVKCNKSGILTLIKLFKLMHGKLERRGCFKDQYNPLTAFDNTWQESVMIVRPVASLQWPSELFECDAA